MKMYNTNFVYRNNGSYKTAFCGSDIFLSANSTAEFDITSVSSSHIYSTKNSSA